MAKKRAHSRSKQKPKQQSPVPWLLAALAGVAVVIVAILIARPTAPPTPVTIDADGTPRLSVDREQIDFGDVPVNNLVKAEFKLANTGDSPLSISYPTVADVVEGC